VPVFKFSLIYGIRVTVFVSMFFTVAPVRENGFMKLSELTRND